MGYSGRYFSNSGFLGTGPERVSDVVYTVIVDGHPRLRDFLLTWNSEKGWLKEEFDEKDVAFVNAVKEEIDKYQRR
jgi:hypothetical protein